MDGPVIGVEPDVHQPGIRGTVERDHVVPHVEVLVFVDPLGHNRGAKLIKRCGNHHCRILHDGCPGGTSRRLSKPAAKARGQYGKPRFVRARSRVAFNSRKALSSTG